MDKESEEEYFWEMYSSSVILFNIRFSYYISKISTILSTIQSQLSEPLSTLDLDDDIMEREKFMIAEFERRFSRINLYSIQLKSRKLEKEIMLFESRSCKIAQSFALRATVLSLLKNLTNSLQTYLKFLRKMNLKVFLKLKELLNYICHVYEMVRYIVDHRSIEMQDLGKMSFNILKILQNQKMSNQLIEYNMKIGKNKKTVLSLERGIVKMPYKSNKYRKPLKKSIDNTSTYAVQCPATHMSTSKTERKYIINEQQTENSKINIVSEKKRKNAHFEIFSTGNEDKSEKILRSNRRSRSLRNRLSSTTVRLCDTILNDLILEVVEDIIESTRSIAIDAFNRELFEAEK